MNTDSAPISVGLGSHPFGGQKDDPHRAVHGGPLYARRRVMPMLLAVVQDAPQAGLAFTYRDRLLAKNAIPGQSTCWLLNFLDFSIIFHQY